MSIFSEDLDRLAPDSVILVVLVATAI